MSHGILNVWRGLWTWVLPIVGFVMTFGLVLSPAFVDQIGQVFDGALQAEARIQTCEPRRNGAAHETVIRCRFSFRHDGHDYVSEGTAWRSANPFLTTEGLHRELHSQLAQPKRVAFFQAARPSEAELTDTRWLAMPPLWVWLSALVVISLVVIVRFEPDSALWGRRGLAPAPNVDDLSPGNDSDIRRGHQRIVLQTIAATLVVGICMFSLSNQPANWAAKAFLTGLQPVSAQLADCSYRWVGTRRGTYRIECAVNYIVGEQAFRTEAESLKFGFFPTQSRLEDQVDTFEPDTAVTVHVDPNYPTYAWAFVSTDMFVPFTWGLFEAVLIALMVMGIVFIARNVLMLRSN